MANLTESLSKLRNLGTDTLKSRVDKMGGLSTINKTLISAQNKAGNEEERNKIEQIRQEINTKLSPNQGQQTTTTDTGTQDTTSDTGVLSGQSNFGYDTTSSYRTERNKKIAQALSERKPNVSRNELFQSIKKQAPNVTDEEIQNTVTDIFSKMGDVDTGRMNGVGEGDTGRMNGVGEGDTGKTEGTGEEDTGKGISVGDEDVENKGQEKLGEADLSMDTSQQNVEDIRTMYDNMKSSLDETNKELKQNLKEMQGVNEETKNKLDTVIENRTENVKQSFEDIKQQYSKLREQLLETYDKNVEQRAQAQATGLAERGMLTDEQAAQAAQRTINQYKDQAELQRSKIDQKITEGIIQARKEKEQMIDSIQQQAGQNAITKNKLTQQVQNMYNNILNQYQNARNQLDQFKISNILQQRQPQIALEKSEEAAKMKDEINNAINQQQLERANNSREDRIRFLMNSIRNVSPDLIGYAADEVRKQARQEGFMQQDPQQQYLDILSEGYKQYAQSQESGSDGYMDALAKRALINNMGGIYGGGGNNTQQTNE